MKWRLLKNPLVLATGLVLISLFILPVSSGFAQLFEQDITPQNSVRQLSESEIKTIAKNITVKVFKKEKELWGSGVLIKQESEQDEKIYTVATNYHVVAEELPTYSIQTPDGKKYQAELIKIDFGNTDLALLKFKAKKDYQVASLKPAFSLAILNNQTEVFVSGYPTEKSSKEPVFESGLISVLLPLAINRGYQIGFSIDIQNGMSGGPLLNHQGELIGLIGKSSYPPSGYPRAYLFEDGSEPIVPENLMISASWAIPIEILAKQADTQLPLTLAWNETPDSEKTQSVEVVEDTKPNGNHSDTNPDSKQPKDTITGEGNNPPPQPEISDICKKIHQSFDKGDVYLSCQDGQSDIVNVNFTFLINSSKLNIENYLSIPSENLQSKTLQIQDLDGDNEVEFLISFLYKNPSCGTDTTLYIYSYNQPKDTAKKNFIQSNYRIEDIYKKGTNFQIISYDGRLGCHFTNQYQEEIMKNILPSKIYEYQKMPNSNNKIIVDTTDNSLYKKDFPQRQIHNFFKYYNSFNGKRYDWPNKKDELKVMIAGYLANQYLLYNAEQEGKNIEEEWEKMKKWYLEEDKEEYFKNLEKLLKDTGYIKEKPPI